MSNKIFGITVVDNIPYIRTIFFVNNEIENSLTNENRSITGITKLINIQDDCHENHCIENENLTIQNTEFNGENYNGEFHLFINEEYTNGYYTNGNISYQDNIIETTIPFINKFNIEEIKQTIDMLKQLRDNTTEINELEDKQHKSITIPETEAEPTPDKTEGDLLVQIKDLNANISNIDASIQDYKQRLEHKIQEQTVIDNKLEEKEEETKEIINEIFEKPKLEELKTEIEALSKTSEDPELQEKIINAHNEINSLNEVLDSTTNLVYNKIKQTTDETEKNRIIAEEKIITEKKIQEMKAKLENLKATEENTTKISVEEHIENLKSVDKQIKIDTKQITPVNNNMSIITNTQGKLSDNLITTIQTIIPQFETLKNQLQGIQINEITGGANTPEQEEQMKKCIELYIGIVQYIIYRPIFYKLTSLKCDDFKKLLLNTETQLYDGTMSGNNKHKVNNEFLNKMYNTLLSFMYINMSAFEGSTIIDKFFYENNKGISYDTALNKYKLYNENYNILLDDNTKEESSETGKAPTKSLLIIYIAEFINLLSKLLKNDDVNKSAKNINYKYNLYETILTYITSQYDLLNTIVEKYFKILELQDNEEFRDAIDKNIETINNNNIIAYLKLRNDEDKKQQYNDRFKIAMNQSSIENPNKIIIEYMDDNIPYYSYNKEDEEYVLTEDIKQKAQQQPEQQTNYNLNEILNTVEIQKYKYSYLFGPFAHIFKPHVKNEEIAENMIVIKEKIKENKPIFMIGYGASGAGKTSSLIYFKKNNENGILINLCNQFGSEGVFDKIELKCKEFYHTTGVGSVEDPEIVNVPNEEIGAIKFTFDKSTNNFVLSEEYKHQTHHQYRLLIPTKEHFEKETLFKKGSKLGEVIIHLIDTDRFVKATTNNPNSSRSHTLVFVKLIGKDNANATAKEKIGNIIIGDFAGVENKFSCEDPNTIQAFLSVKRDNVKDADGNEIYVPYYSTEAYNGNPDPFGIIEPLIKPTSNNNNNNSELTQQGGSSTIPEQCIEKIEVKDPIYNFENPTIRTEWKLTDADMITYYKENNYKNLKMVFNIILNYLKMNNKANAEQFKGELELYSNINANKGSSTEQVIKNIEQNLNKLLEKTDTSNKLTRLRANEKTKTTDTTQNKSIITQFTTDINNILTKNKVPLIKQLPFKDAAFRGQQLGPFTMAYQEDINQIINNIREQYKSVELLTTIFKNYTLSQEEFNKLKEFIFKQHGEYDNLLELTKDLQVETSCRTENSNVICENRREEGYFINNSLEKVREVIKKILFEKNKNSINITPDFIDICFKNYCPTHSNCFSFDSFDNKPLQQDKTGSVIFDQIYNVLKETKGYTTPTEMYEDIIISIFCVFNISRGANNPPPTPYLDINKLKQLFYYQDILNNSINNTYQLDFISECEEIINKISKEFVDKVSDLKTIKSNISKQKTIFDLFNQVKEYFINNKSKIDNKTYNQLYKFYIKEFIDMIDKSNSVSAIGTLEFLDQIAKFNTIKTICNTQDISTPSLEIFNTNTGMNLLYGNTYGGSDKNRNRNRNTNRNTNKNKYTKKHRLYKEKRNTKKK